MSRHGFLFFFPVDFSFFFGCLFQKADIFPLQLVRFPPTPLQQCVQWFLPFPWYLGGEWPWPEHFGLQLNMNDGQHKTNPLGSHSSSHWSIFRGWANHRQRCWKQLCDVWKPKAKMYRIWSKRTSKLERLRHTGRLGRPKDYSLFLLSRRSAARSNWENPEPRMVEVLARTIRTSSPCRRMSTLSRQITGLSWRLKTVGWLDIFNEKMDPNTSKYILIWCLSWQASSMTMSSGCRNFDVSSSLQFDSFWSPRDQRLHHLIMNSPQNTRDFCIPIYASSCLKKKNTCICIICAVVIYDQTCLTIYYFILLHIIVLNQY